MALKLWTALAVFLGSYLPLSLILLVQDCTLVCSPLGRIPFPKHPFLSLPLLAGTLFCFLFTIALLHVVPANRSIKIIEAKYIPSEMINYTLPYIVSFMSVSYDDLPKLLGFLIFFAIIFLITLRAGRIFVNPLLIVFGWRAYEITYTFAGDTLERKTIGLAKAPDIYLGFYKGAQIEDLLLLRQDVGAEIWRT